MAKESLGWQAMDCFDGSERVGPTIPRWVAEAVLRERLPHVQQLKCAFVLYPAEVRPFECKLENQQHEAPPYNPTLHQACLMQSGRAGHRPLGSGRYS